MPVLRPRLPVFLAALLVLLGCVPSSRAQLPGFPSKPAASQRAASGQSADATEARLQTWLKEATAFVRDSKAGSETRLPQGIDSVAFADHRRNLEQIVISIGSYQKILAATPDARQALEEAREALNTWVIFSEKPPYSVLLIDSLLDQQDSLNEKAASYRSSLELFTRSLSKVQEDARIAEDSSRQSLGDAAGNPSQAEAALWKLGADRAKSRLLALRAMYYQSNTELLQVREETARLQLALLDRKLKIARKQPTLTDKDLSRVTEAMADRQKTLRQEIQETRDRQSDAIRSKAEAQTALDKLTESTTGAREPEAPAGVALAQANLEAADVRAASCQFIIEKLESLDQLDALTPDIYQFRKDLLEATTKESSAAALQALRSHDDRLNAWKIVLGNEMASVNADIANRESQATSMTDQDPRKVPINAIRAAMWEKQAVMQKVSQFATSQGRTVKRWLDEYGTAEVKSTFRETVSGAASATWTAIVRFWNVEVFQYKETVEAAGVPITQTLGVPLGRIIMALVYFLAAYFGATAIKNRLRGLIVRRGHLAEPQARTLANWSMIAVGILLAVITLHFLRIPLTVFAFFGGALAIGLGFGTQTIIKNFICGIIMLFERKIRVGDVLDFEGKMGTVTEVNTRSSVIRNFDGRETLVPNSVFLEKNITNLTLNDRNLRRFLLVNVAYGNSPHDVTHLLMECADRHGLVLKTPAPLVIFQDFGENAMVFKLYFWVTFNAKTNGELVESDLRQMVEKSFSEAGISFPYPRRDINLHSDSPIKVQMALPAARKKSYSDA